MNSKKNRFQAFEGRYLVTIKVLKYGWISTPSPILPKMHDSYFTAIIVAHIVNSTIQLVVRSVRAYPAFRVSKISCWMKILINLR